MAASARHAARPLRAGGGSPPARGPSPSARLGVLGSAAALSLIVIQALGSGGCTLPTEGKLSVDCSDSTACDDGNPCTDDACGADGVCAFTIRSEYPSAAQVPSDCLRTECQGGEPVTLFDPTDVPNDANDCTEDGCTEDGPVNAALPSGSPCDDGNGHSGTCGQGAERPIECLVQCTADTASEVCDDGNDCSGDECDTTSSLCTHEYLNGVPPPNAAQTPADCLVITCQDGQQAVVLDETDGPDDGNDCTQDLCIDGVPSSDHPLLPEDTPCDGGFCNRAGVCAPCTRDAQCGEATCGCVRCTDGQCVYEPEGALAEEACGDARPCHAEVCDGHGGHTDSTVADGTPCDDNLYCNGPESCAAGVCVNSWQSPCPGPDGDTNCKESCNEQRDDCTAKDPVDSPCSGGTKHCDATGKCVK